MKQCLITFLFFTGLITLVLSVAREYHLIQSPKTWSDAQAYCRSNFDDLATIETNDDVIKLYNESQLHQLTSKAWIGLYTERSGWHWTLGDEPLSEAQWHSSNPTNGNNICAILSYYAGWWNVKCKGPRAFVCFDETLSGDSRYIFYSTMMTFDEARSYCQQHHTDMACGRTSAENSILRQTMSVELGYIWLGLFRAPWKWSDGTNMSNVFSWITGTPDNILENENCGYFEDSRTSDAQCSDAMPFFCQNILYPRIQQTIKVKVKSNQNVKDPAVKAAILEKIKQKLEEHGMAENTTLKWKEKSNGDIFTKQRNNVQSSTDEKCDV